MEMRRRDFLKGIAGSGALLGLGSGPALARPPRPLLPDAVGMLYDATVCIGCKVCVSACKQHNDMPPEHTSLERVHDDPLDLSSKTLNIIKLYTHGTSAVKDREIDGYSYIKRHCMHCVDPACVSACPVSALTKNPENGIVEYNKNACLGCRYCQIACPFNIPKFQWDDPFPQIMKCQLCSHRIEKGGYSACCEFCPTGASIFGKVTDLIAEAGRRLTLKPAQDYPYPIGQVTSAHHNNRRVSAYLPHLYGKKEGGGTQVLMLSGVPFDKLGLPILPEISDANRSESIQHTIYNKMIAPVGLLGVLLYKVYINTRDEE
jgi:Fe-S-cluster-containing dehydrogenase component